MPYIHLTIFIAAPRERVFDLSRSILVHLQSMKDHKEEVVEGKKKGLMDKGETITWKVGLLMKKRIIKVKITQMQRPDFFVDEQESGDFKMMKHEHYFKAIENGTLMIDQFHYEAPYGFMGKMVNRLFLEKYITGLLEKRNAAIKSIAEGNRWIEYMQA
jgi:ligand-binding SRPBCC domain-containing protein